MSPFERKPLCYLDVPRPQFDRMIADLERARKMWGTPDLHAYSRVLLRLVGSIALEDSAVEPMFNRALTNFNYALAEIERQVQERQGQSEKRKY